MIPKINIGQWNNKIAWGNPNQIEHDLILCKALCCIYNHPQINNNLLFRGGTALHKIFFSQAGRFSEDLDFVQIEPGPIGLIINAIREALDPWLGIPSWKNKHGRFVLNYKYKTSFAPNVLQNLKIEINTREHYSRFGIVEKYFAVENHWFTGATTIYCYCANELLGTKLRALYQRKKGRDLYDFWHAFKFLPEINEQEILSSFTFYLDKENFKISRASFEKNLAEKQSDPVFNADIAPLLTPQISNMYNLGEAYDFLYNRLICLLPGKSWKGFEATKAEKELID